MFSDGSPVTYEGRVRVKEIRPAPLHREPTSVSEVMVLLPTGQRIRALGKPVNGWARVRVGDRAVGYLQGYVRLEDLEHDPTGVHHRGLWGSDS